MTSNNSNSSSAINFLSSTGFKFQAYEPLDPSIPSSASSTNNNKEQAVPQIVEEAINNFPTFQYHIHPSEKESVSTTEEAKKVLVKGRVENRANSDLESTIQDQRVKADAAVGHAIEVLGKTNVTMKS